MKHVYKLSLQCVLIATALGSASAFAAGAVYQKSTGSASIELSNIEEGDGSQAPVATGQAGAPAGKEPAAPAAHGATPNATPIRAALGRTVPTKRKTTKSVDDTENSDSDNADVAEQDANTQDNQTGRSESDAGAAPGAAANGGQYFGSSSGSVGQSSGTMGSGYSGGSTGGVSSGGTGSTASSGGSSSGTAASSNSGSTSGSTSGSGSTASSGGTSSGASTGSAAAAPNTAGLDASLQRYRDMMLQLSQTPAGNPAIIRRYQAIDRNGYRGMLGL